MRLHGQSILVVEDETLIASYLAEIIEDAGGRAVGPAECNRRALDLIAAESVTAAVLDVNLCDGTAVPVAAALAARKIPFVIHTGCPLPLRLRSALGAAPVLNKMAPAKRMVDTLADAIAGRAVGRSGAVPNTASLGHVLLIEDEPSTAVILAGHMRALGCDSVEQVDTEVGALVAASRRRPDLMVVDVRLREGNGLSAARTISDTYGVPLIVVTAHPPHPAALDQALVVRKPFDAARLKAAVAHACQPGPAR